MAVVLSWLVVGGAVGPALSAGAATPGGVGPSVRVVGPAPTLPSGASVVGPSDTSAIISVDVGLKPHDSAALDSFVAAVSRPGSPQYHHYLAPGQFATTFGPDTATIDATRSWLSSSGLRLGATSPDGLLIPVSGTAGQVERALDVSLVSTRLADGRVARFAPQLPAVPATLASSVAGVVGLSTVATPEAQLVPTGQGGSSAPGGSPRAGPRPWSRPSDRGRAPRRPTPGGTRPISWPWPTGSTTCTGAVWTGRASPSGSTNSSLYTPSDVATYEACYGIATSVTDFAVDGGPGTTAQAGEAALDIEDVIGLAPGATIKATPVPRATPGPSTPTTPW